jgi:hypothetical protein
MDVGHIRDEPHVGTVGSEVAFDEVGHARGRFRAGLCRDAEGPWFELLRRQLDQRLNRDFAESANPHNYRQHPTTAADLAGRKRPETSA